MTHKQKVMSKATTPALQSVQAQLQDDEVRRVCARSGQCDPWGFAERDVPPLFHPCPPRANPRLEQGMCGVTWQSDLASIQVQCVGTSPVSPLSRGGLGLRSARAHHASWRASEHTGEHLATAGFDPPSWADLGKRTRVPCHVGSTPRLRAASDHDVLILSKRYSHHRKACCPVSTFPRSPSSRLDSSLSVCCFFRASGCPLLPSSLSAGAPFSFSCMTTTERVCAGGRGVGDVKGHALERSGERSRQT